MISTYLDEVQTLLSSVPQKNIQTLIDMIDRTIGTIYLCGNGGSSATAEHAVCDLMKGNAFAAKRKVINLSDNTALITAIANDISYRHIYSFQLEKATPEDLLILISCGGNSGNIIEAMKKAEERNVSTFALLGTDGGIIGQCLDQQHSIIVKSNNYGMVEGVHDIILHLVSSMIF
jgi:D-sedoheptulose 7-phosphate isomerase